MSKHTNPVQKVSIFFENKKVLKLFRFSYKIANTANFKTAITSNITWIWRLKFGLRVQNESYFILFTHIFDFDPNGIFFGELTNFGDLTILTNHFNQPFLVWIFGDYLNHTFFESIIFPASRKHARRFYLSRNSMKSCLGVVPVT